MAAGRGDIAAGRGLEQLERRLLMSATFTDIGLSLASAKAAWGDYDNDGYVDLYAGYTLYRNDNGNGFTAVNDAFSGSGIWGDYDNDGKLDLFTYTTGSEVTLRLYRNASTPTEAIFEDVTSILPYQGVMVSRGASWGDFDGDGFIDLYVGGYEGSPGDWPDRIFHNEGGTGFTNAWTATSGHRARGVTSADFDDDGDLDIYVSNYRLQDNLLFRNNGDFSFVNVASSYGVAGAAHTVGSAWGDIDNDGLLDLFVGNFSHPGQEQSHFYRNRGPAGGYTFEDRGTGGVAWQESFSSPTLGDYDNDGDLDLFFTTVYGGNFPVLYSNSNGSFSFSNVTSSAGLGGIQDTYQAAWADIDNDGDLDLVTGGRIYRNNNTDNTWLKVKLHGDGQTINTAAIGAKVKVTFAGKTLTRQVEAGTGEGNQNDMTLHFGLGGHAGQVQIEVIWKDGPDGLRTFHTASANVSVELSMNQAPSPPTNLQAQDVLQDRATITWDASTDGDGDEITYELQYRKNDNSEPWITVRSTKNNSLLIRDLDRNTSYRVRVQASDDGSDSGWTRVNDLFTTTNHPNNAPDRPGAITVTDVHGRAATLHWERGIDPERDTLSYVIEYRVDGETDWTGGHAADDTTYTLDGLLDNTTYDVRIASFDGQLTSAWRGGQDLFTTLDTNSAPSAPSNLTAEVVKNSATVRWDAAVDPDGDALTYQLRHRAAGQSWSAYLDVAGTEYTVVDLLDNTAYDVRVRALDHRTNGPALTELELFVSGEANHKPSRPDNLSANNVARRTATVTWGPSTDPNAGDTVSYAFQWKQFGDPDWSSSTHTTSPSVDLVGLDKGKKVDVRVRATDGALFSGWVTDVNLFRTNAAPTVPANLTAEVLGHDRARLNWDTATDVNDDIVHYEVQYRRAGESWGDAKVKTANNTTTVLSDLDALSTYDVRVRAVDTLGTGGFEGSNGLFSTEAVPNRAPEVPEHITATNVTDTSALIDWDDVVDPEGDAVTYTLRYRVSGTEAFTTVASGLTASHYTLTELQADTRYDVRLVADDGTQTSARNFANLFTTAQAAEPVQWRYLAMENLRNVRKFLRR